MNANTENEQIVLPGQLRQVARFWGTEGCGSHFIKYTADRKEFYQDYTEFRYRTSWHIPMLVPFSEARNKEVLEIGCGNGTDGVMFASNGADYTGVDLTQTAVDATKDHFSLLGLPGRFKVENAERLTFPDETFDIVYSFGVLHHTPNPARAIEEVYRVLKPRGKAIIMLYHKNSFNYFVRIMLYIRLRVLLEILFQHGNWKTDKNTRSPGRSFKANEHQDVWQSHYENFLRQGWKYLDAANFIHHSTDGPGCPFAYVYSKAEARQIFSSFREATMRVGHFPLKKHFCPLIPLWFEKFLASRIGFHLLIFAEK